MSAATAMDIVPMVTASSAAVTSTAAWEQQQARAANYITDFEILRDACTAEEDVIKKVKRTFPELTTATVMRHLIVCDNDYDKTCAHLEACKAWRQSTFPITSMSTHQAPAGVGLLYAHGTDVMGHPLIIYNSRWINPKTRNVDVLMRWFIYMLELALSRLGPNMTQVTALVNRSGSTYEVDLEFGKRIQFVLENYYPERICHVIFYPVSTALKASWSVMKILASRTYARFRLAHTLDKLRHYIPDECIPKEMGGSSPYVYNTSDYFSVDEKTQIFINHFKDKSAVDERREIDGHSGTYGNGSAINGISLTDKDKEATIGSHSHNLCRAEEGYGSYQDQGEINLEDLYEPEAVDDFAAKSINQPSVGGSFIQKRPNATTTISAPGASTTGTTGTMTSSSGSAAGISGGATSPVVTAAAGENGGHSRSRIRYQPGRPFSALKEQTNEADKLAEEAFSVIEVERVDSMDVSLAGDDSGGKGGGSLKSRVDKNKGVRNTTIPIPPSAAAVVMHTPHSPSMEKNNKTSTGTSGDAAGGGAGAGEVESTIKHSWWCCC